MDLACSHRFKYELDNESMSALSLKNLYTVLSFLQMPITVSLSSSADGAALFTTIP